MFEIPKFATVKLDNVSTRKEHHGEALVAAIDLTLTYSCNNRVLDLIAKGVRESFYMADDVPLDGVQEEMSLPVDELPNIRFTKLHYPLKFDVDYTGFTLRVDYGAGANGSTDLIFGMCKIKMLQVTPVNGGTSQIKFTASSNADIDERLIGKISMLQQSDITMTLVGPTVGADADADAEQQSIDTAKKEGKYPFPHGEGKGDAAGKDGSKVAKGTGKKRGSGENLNPVEPDATDHFVAQHGSAPAAQ